MPLTVSQIAERVIGTDETRKAALIERMRHWTREGLLSPEGDRNPGTGRHRVYDDSIIFDVAILNALADQGLTVGRQRLLMVTSVLVQQAKKLWASKGKKGRTLYLEIAHFADPNPQGGTEAVFLHVGPDDLIHPRADSSFVLNVSRIFAQLDKQT
jgi:hypothetical protein